MRLVRRHADADTDTIPFNAAALVVTDVYPFRVLSFHGAFTAVQLASLHLIIKTVLCGHTRGGRRLLSLICLNKR